MGGVVQAEECGLVATRGPPQELVETWVVISCRRRGAFPRNGVLVPARV
jgi:hypothetical protein